MMYARKKVLLYTNEIKTVVKLKHGLIWMYGVRKKVLLCTKEVKLKHGLMWMYGVRKKVLLCTKEIKTGSKTETWFDLDVWC